MAGTGRKRSFHEIVAGVARGLSLESSLDSILEGLLRGAGEVLGADAQAFWELDFVRGGVSCRTHSGLPEAYQQAVSQHYERVPTIDGTIIADLRLGKPVLVEDSATDGRVHPVVAASGFRSVLFAPVMLADVPHGVLAFYYGAGKKVGSADVALSFAGVAALALRHAAMIEEQDRALAEARLLLESSEAITSSLSLDEILDEILELVPRSLGFLACRIYFSEEDGLVRVRPRGGEGVRKPLNELAEGFRLALETLEPQVLVDEAFFGKLSEGAGAPVGAALAVPLLVRGGPAGLFVVGRSPEDPEFTRADFRILKAMARHAAVAIEHARLVQWLESSRAELQDLASSLEDRVEERSRQLESAHQELVRAERMASLGRLAATVAHEVRNPLAVIRTSAYYLKSRLKTADERVARHLEMIESQVHLAGKIVSDLLDFSRDAAPERAPLSLNRLVEKVLERVSVQPPIQLEVDLEPDLPEIFADEVHLEQSIRNLVHNAVEAMPEGGLLTLRSRTLENRVLLEVLDTGEGIEAGDLERIFDPLYTTRPEGCGLGLTLTQKLVKGHGGLLEVESERGKGTSFRIVLPLDRGERL